MMLQDISNLQKLNKECHQCGLRAGCSQVVTGNVRKGLAPRIFLVGEAPGADEDTDGEPFVGRSGKLLTKLLDKAGIDRDECYVTNTVKCRPPKNRKPEEEEIQACKIWLWKELQTVSPTLIITFGKVPTVLLLKLKKNIKMGDYVGKPVVCEYMKDVYDEKTYIMPCYHPSYLLRQGGKKDDMTIEWLKKAGELL